MQGVYECGLVLVLQAAEPSSDPTPIPSLLREGNALRLNPPVVACNKQLCTRRSVGFAARPPVACYQRDARIRLHRILGFSIRLEAFLALQMLISSAVGNFACQIPPICLARDYCLSNSPHQSVSRGDARIF